MGKEDSFGYIGDTDKIVALSTGEGRRWKNIDIEMFFELYTSFTNPQELELDLIEMVRLEGQIETSIFLGYYIYQNEDGHLRFVKAVDHLSVEELDVDELYQKFEIGFGIEISIYRQQRVQCIKVYNPFFESQHR
jgi:hypothetical protein